MLLGLGCLLVVGPSTLLTPDLAVGHASRDLFDHLALLDHWSMTAPDWNLPSGGSLVPPDLFGMVFAAPVLAVASRATAYNVAVFCQLWAASAAAWALGRRYGSGMVAGVVFGLSPYLMGQALSGEAETLSAWPLPLWALLLSRDSVRSHALAGVVGAIAAIGSWYHGAFLAMLTGFWSLVGLVRDKRPAALVPSVVFAAVISPFAWVYARVLNSDTQLFAGPQMRDYLEVHAASLSSMSADVCAWAGAPPPGSLHIDGFGWVALGLAIWGAWRWSHDSARGWWLGVVGIGLVMSVGPVLHACGAAVTGWTPYALLVDLPAFGRMRLPHRWTLVTTLGLAVLAAHGARRLPGVIPVFVFFEALWFVGPVYQATDVSPPAIVDRIEGPVLDLPPRTLGDDLRGRYLVWQAVHNQAVPYALLMQGWSPELAREPLFIAAAAADARSNLAERQGAARQFRQGDFAQDVADWREDPRPDALEGAALRLSALGLRQVVLHRDRLDPGSDLALMALLEAHLGDPAVVGDQALWELPHVE